MTEISSSGAMGEGGGVSKTAAVSAATYLDSAAPLRTAPAATTMTTTTTTTTTRATTSESAGQAQVFCAEDDEELSVAQHMIAGAVAGMTEHMAMFPVDTVKTRMQSYMAVRDYANASMASATRSIVGAEGVRALWRGVGAVAISAGPAHALYFATYEAVREATAPSHRIDGEVHAVATAFAGVCATVVNDGVMTPLDVVKQRMQLCGKQVYGSVYECVKHVYEHHGVGAFFAGYRATLVMNVPFTAVYFCGYESAKRLILRWRGLKEGQFSGSSHCVAGAIAGACAAASTNPLDVVKTRLQTQGEVGARRYGGLAHALRSIGAEEGAGGLMRGVRARVLFHVPAAAMCWSTYELCKHAMGGGAASAPSAAAPRAA